MRSTGAAIEDKGQSDSNLDNKADSEITNDFESKSLEDSSQNSDATSSVFSIESGSSHTSAETGDMAEAGTSILVDLLTGDKLIMNCCQDALRIARFRPGRVQNKLRRLLRKCATNLKRDQLLDQYDRQILGVFIKHYSRNASSIFCTSLTDGYGALSHRLGSSPDGRDHQVKVEQYLKGERDRFALSDHSVPATGYEPESDSDSEEDEDDMSEVEFPNLSHFRRVLVGCEAFQRLRHDLLNFVYPSLDERVKRLAAKFTDPAHPKYLEYRRYPWARIVVEMRYFVPGTILLDHPQREGWVNTVQGAAEAWTRMRWDWWPLKPYIRDLSEHERRLSWTCACGEERWMELPAPFVYGLDQCIADYIETEPRMQALKKSLSDPSGGVPRSYSYIAWSLFPKPQSKFTVNWSSAGEFRTCRFLYSNPNASDQHISGNSNYKSAPASDSEICVHQLDDNAFFQSLRSDYCRLRGWLRNHLSVWRYSHCDFYQFEKFDDSRYAPKLKDDYPKSRDHYEYNPDPMDIVPPITDHEFNSRFYDCYCSNKRGLLHFFHPCKKASGHSCDALQLLPKKKTRLEKHGDKRQTFWGIYAQEIVCFRWVVAYHVVCLLPMVVFFFLWMFPLGYKGDLQDAAIPLTLVLGMLTLFWSLFLGSIRFAGPI